MFNVPRHSDGEHSYLMHLTALVCFGRDFGVPCCLIDGSVRPSRARERAFLRIRFRTDFEQQDRTFCALTSNSLLRVHHLEFDFFTINRFDAAGVNQIKVALESGH